MPIAKQRPKPAQNGVCRLAVQLLVDDRLDTRDRKTGTRLAFTLTGPIFSMI
jgi:hypothetical protein